MRDPRSELRDYLQRLVYRYFNLGSLQRELHIIEGWRSRSGTSAYGLGTYFFALVGYSFRRIILVELASLLSEGEEKSLLDWLGKAREHAAHLQPSLYDASCSRQRSMVLDEYREIIERQLSEIGRHQDTIERIKTHRDKAIAHLDRAYFNNPEKLYMDYPLKDDDIDCLLDLVKNILRNHYEYLFNVDADLEVGSAATSDTLLRYAEAFLRAGNDRDLIAKGFRPRDYLVDARQP